MLTLSPIGQRRWARFKAHRRGWWSLWLFLILFGASLGAELIANDRPPKTKAERLAAMPQPTHTLLEQHSTEEMKRRTIDAED